MDGKRMPNRAQLQRLIHALGLNARQAEHLTTNTTNCAAAPRPTVPMRPCTSCCRRRCAPATTLMNDVLAPMPRSEADLEAAFTSRCYQGYQAVTQQLHRCC